VRNHSRSTDRAQLKQDGELMSGGAVARVKGATAFLRLLARLPRVDIRLSDSSSGREIDSYLKARARGFFYHNRIAQGVLCVPERAEDYLRGKSRQAVRTNLSRAKDARLQCHPVYDIDDRSSLAAELGMDEWIPKLVDRPHDPVWVVRDGTGENAGLLWATVDSDCAMLRLLVATRSEARYVLHTALVKHLCAEGVSYLFARNRGALMLAPGLQYFQRLLGYQVAHLRVQRRPRWLALRWRG
jgi:hypothetical protein